MDSVTNHININDRILKMSTRQKEFKVGDLIIPLVAGIMELGDPPFEITEINGGAYTCKQQIGSYKSTLVLSSSRMKHI